jgi:hypothetical protein
VLRLNIGAVYTRVGISKLCSTEGWIYGVDWRWSELLSGYFARFDIIPYKTRSNKRQNATAGLEAGIDFKITDNLYRNASHL